MADAIPSDTRFLHKSPDCGLPLQRQRNEKGKRLVDLEYGLRAMELHVAAVEAELKDLEGFSLTSLVAGIKGDRSARVQAMRQEVQNLQGKLEAAAANVETLRQEVEQLEQRIAAGESTGRRLEAVSADKQQAEGGAPVAAAPEAPATDRQSLEAQAKMISRAAEALEEARKGLLADLETVSSLGGFGIGSVVGGLNGLMAATRARTRKHISDQFRADILRFLRRFDEAVAPTASTDEAEVRAKLAQVAEDLSGTWIRHNRLTQEVTDGVLQTFAFADMLLEKRLNDIKKRQSPGPQPAVGTFSDRPPAEQTKSSDPSTKG